MEAQSRLMSLPRELRDMILDYVLDDYAQERINFNRRHNVQEQIITTPLRALPSICATSQQLYAEAMPLFLCRVTPVSHNVATTIWLRRWLATFPLGLGYDCIQELSFRNFHGPEQIKGYELITLCPNLRYLSIMFGDEYSNPGTVPSMAIKPLSSSANVYENLDNIILMHQLRKLTEVTNLELLEFGFHDWDQPISFDRARQVKEWLRVKFRAKGKDVPIVCKQMRWNGMYSTDD
ncbi:hypothetical protein EK21DRAFT_102393 [Setomelanomma holmii]|uniref:F-box domain-containing protein n=1 Tax=Setomelanomma holmii TaxID=210430 RepID=A0A9P4H6S8_9PLEO|nr:hypothetical protein EK21DRAFT_102393 [Setomelanomma holmii]